MYLSKLKSRAMRRSLNLKELNSKLFFLRFDGLMADLFGIVKYLGEERWE